MDAISSLMTSINPALAAAGTGFNIFSGIQNLQSEQQQKANQSYISNLLKSPSATANAAAAYTQPLTAGLTDAVTNQAQGALAERGLGGSPAAVSSDIAQAIAPYVQQNQTTGLNALMQSLGILGNTKAPQIPTLNLSGILKQLNTQNQDPNANANEALSNAQNTFYYGDTSSPDMSDVTV